MKIFAIIVTYNAMWRGWIDHCLESLQKSTVPITAIVIDNLSTDGTREHVPQHYPDAVWLPQNKNLGFGQANNVGIRYALEHDADYVLLLNQDAHLAENTLELMLEQSDKESLLSPLQLNGDGNRLDFMFRVRMRDAENSFFDDIAINKQLSSKYRMQAFPAACWLMPISIIKRIGGFNPLFYHYGEDDNYLHRVRYHHICIYMIPQAKMFHDRNEHGNMTIFSKNLCRRLLLIAACDINASLPSRMIQWGRILTRCYTEALPKHQYTPGEFLRSAIWIIRKWVCISKSRRKEKQIGPNWI